MKMLWTFDWLDAFQDPSMHENILEKIREVRTMNWVVASVAGVVNLIGFLVLLSAPDIRVALIGLYVALVAMMFMVLIAVLVNFYVTRYWIIWERQNRLAVERRKVEATDL